MSRNNVFDAILLLRQERGEKDTSLQFLTSFDKIVIANDYHSQKSGSKSFPLFFTGEIYLYKKEDTQVYTLKDSSIKIPRLSLLSSPLFLSLFGFVDCIKFFASFNYQGLFKITNIIFDYLNNALLNLQNFDKTEPPASLICDIKKLFIYFAESFFSIQQSFSNYHICPICNKEYDKDETLGYSVNIYEPACNKCAELRNVFPPGVRRYLNYISNMDLDSMLSVEIHDRALENVVNFEKFRLLQMNKNAFKNLQFI